MKVPHAGAERWMSCVERYARHFWISFCQLIGCSFCAFEGAQISPVTHPTGIVVEMTVAMRMYIGIPIVTL